MFRVEEFLDFHAVQGGRSPATSATVLKQAIAAGRLLHLRRGLYAAVPHGVSPDAVQVAPFLLASRHTPDAVVAFHSALQLHGRGYSVWSRMHVWTSRGFVRTPRQVQPISTLPESRAAYRRLGT